MVWILLIFGLIFLAVGGEMLIRGAVRLASLLGVSPLVVGLTIVAFGTSAPELVVSINAALTGHADICLGNVIGSNIFNILFILGVCALIAPLQVLPNLIRYDVPVMIGSSFLLLILVLDGNVSRLDGALFLCGLVSYIWFSFRVNKSERNEFEPEIEKEIEQKIDRFPKHVQCFIDGFLVLAGLILLVIGADWLVDSAVSIARGFGISEVVIGLTIVAIGTSLPEVAASIAATIKGQRDIAIGNLIGSNIFNILSILGFSSFVAPKGIDVATSIIQQDLPVMLAVAVVCFPIFFTQKQVSRKEGAFLFICYILYTAYLIFQACQPKAQMFAFLY